MKLIKPIETKVKVILRKDKVKDQYRVGVKQLIPKPDKGKPTVWTFTVYDSDLQEIKELLINTFEEATGETLPVTNQRKARFKVTK